MHCWHQTGVSKLVNPPQIEEICCYCNLHRWITETPKGHGKFFPRKNCLPGENSRPYEGENCPER
jgi:hypothetical protein